MSQTGYSKVQIYSSSTASNTPSASNLTNDTNGSELGINITDGKLFYKDNSGTVQVMATKGTGPIGGSNTQVQYNSSGALAGSANFTFNGTTVTMANDASIHGLTVGLGGGSVSTATVVGNGALAATNTGIGTTAVGYQAGAANTSGTNEYFGYQAGYANSTGSGSVFLGHQAGFAGTDIDHTVAVGYQALSSISSGSADDNTAIGYLSLKSNTSGAFNTALGSNSLYSNTTFSSNTAVGYQAGYNVSSGSGTYIGYSAGSNLVNGTGGL